MTSILDTIFTVIVGSITEATRGLTGGLSVLEDFFYVKFRGLSFVVLGARQTGKSTLIEWLRRNMASIENFEPDPTAAGGQVVPDFSTRVGDQYVKLKPNRDVGGEYAMWETDWVELFREAQPRGIIFMIDHTNVPLHKDAWNFVMQMIEDEPHAASQLKAFTVLVNKADLWGEDRSLDDLLDDYRNEHKRLRSQAERLGYKWSIARGSLVTGEGVAEAMRKFFNTIRPKPRQ